MSHFKPTLLHHTPKVMIVIAQVKIRLYLFQRNVTPAVLVDSAGALGMKTAKSTIKLSVLINVKIAVMVQVQVQMPAANLGVWLDVTDLMAQIAGCILLDDSTFNYKPIV